MGDVGVRSWRILNILNLPCVRINQLLDDTIDMLILCKVREKGKRKP